MAEKNPCVSVRMTHDLVDETYPRLQAESNDDRRRLGLAGELQNRGVLDPKTKHQDWVGFSRDCNCRRASDVTQNRVSRGTTQPVSNYRASVEPTRAGNLGALCRDRSR